MLFYEACALNASFEVGKLLRVTCCFVMTVLSMPALKLGSCCVWHAVLWWPCFQCQLWSWEAVACDMLFCDDRAINASFEVGKLLRVTCCFVMTVLSMAALKLGSCCLWHAVLWWPCLQCQLWSWEAVACDMLFCDDRAINASFEVGKLLRVTCCFVMTVLSMPALKLGSCCVWHAVLWWPCYQCQLWSWEAVACDMLFCDDRASNASFDVGKLLRVTCCFVMTVLSIPALKLGSCCVWHAVLWWPCHQCQFWSWEAVACDMLFCDDRAINASFEVGKLLRVTCCFVMTVLSMLALKLGSSCLWHAVLWWPCYQC